MLNPWLRCVDNISIVYLAVNSNEDFLFCRPIAVSVSTSLQQLWFGVFFWFGVFWRFVVGWICLLVWVFCPEKPKRVGRWNKYW